MSEDEKDRARSLPQSSVYRFVSSRGILRKILGFYLGVKPGEIRFSYSEQGKPALGDEFKGSGLRFNLSHSHELALCAVANGREVGVDLEKIVQIHQLDKIVKRFLSTRERDEISKFRGYERIVAFFQLWTRKEAFLKAKGRCLSDSSADMQELLNNLGSCVRSLVPAMGFVGALALELCS